MEERIFTEFEQKQIDALDRTVYNLIESSSEVINRAIMNLRVPSDIDIAARVEGIIASYKRAHAFIKG